MKIQLLDFEQDEGKIAGSRMLGETGRSQTREMVTEVNVDKDGV